MKKIIIIGFCIITLTSLLFFGCKKGPEDPWLSFRSRKTRVSGVWTITAYTVNGIDSLSKTVIDTGNDKTCGTFYTTISSTAKLTWTFDKTGSYDKQTDSSITTAVAYQKPTSSTCKASSITAPARIPTEVKGIWDFAGGVGQFKTKEEIILTDPTDHVDDITYDMIKCSYKELILAQSVTDPLTGLVRIRQWTMTRNK